VSVTNPTLDDAANLVSGNPLVETTTAANGTFTVTNVPPGSQIPMVIQAGRWRREFVIPSVASCTNTPLTNVTQGGFSTLDGYGESTTVRFAQTQGEGDIPKVALVTGKADALECTLRKVGIADTEFTDYTETVSSGGSGPGRINLFEGAGDSGAKAGATTHTEDTLVGSTSSTFSGSLLGDYNVLMLPCQGDSTNYTTADGRTNAIAFTGAGGRIFATHHSAFYINENSPIDTAANWTSDTTIGSATATLNMAFSSGSTLAQWLQAIGSTTTLGQVAMTNLFNDQTGVNSPTEAWATLNTNSDVAQLSFYTPVGAAASSQYGRVMFNEYHVDNTTTSSSVTFPAECTGTMAKTAAMSSQEHMLEYSLFDLMNFAIPVISTNVGIAITTSPSTFTGGDQDDTITVTATNNGTSAIGTSPTVTMAVTLPAGLTAISMIDSAGNWSCTVSTLTCTLLNPLAVSASNSITLTVSVAANVSDGTASIGATMSSAGFSASNTGNVSLDVAPAPAGTITGPVDTTLAPTNVGSTAASPGTLTFAISAGTSIASIQVVTEGFTGKDFTNAGSGTCAVQTYASATTCTVVVNFSPLYPGLRKGAVQLLGGAGSGDNLLDTAYISGFGEGPEAIFQPGAQNTVTSEGGASNFDDVAVDILGNVYVVDFPNHQVLKETFASGSYTQSTAFSSLSGPKGMAIDGAGNIYIADTSAGAVYKETLVNGTYAQNTVVSGLNSPDGVAVDANGNVYIADSSNNRVLLETLSNGSYIQSVIATGLNNPWRVAVDVAGNVYITDTGNNQVLLETLSSGAYTQSAIVTGLSAPRGVAVDSNGTVYIADTGNNRVIQEELVNGSYVQTVLVGGGLNAPRSVAVDELGNLYIADFGDNKLYEEDYSDAPSLSFASTTVNTTSSDSPQTETLVNFGNTALTAVSPGIAAPADFPQVTGNPSDCTTSFSLAAATNCTLRIEFHPLTTGSLAESFVLTDNNLNNSSVTQTIALSGVANPAASIVLSPSSLPAPVIGTAYSQAITASGGTAPYTFAVSSGALPSGLTLSASGILSGTPTAVGSFVFTIQATDSASLTGSQSYTVNIAAPTITVTPSSLPNGTVASSYSQTISATGGSGSYTYAVTAGSLPAGLSLNSSTGALTGTPTAAATSTFTITATDTMTTGSGAPYTGSQAYSLVVNKGTATVTLTNLSQTYTGSPLAATATTNPTGLSVVLTYNGISTIPTTAGTYTVVATINDSNYQGSTTGTLIISRAQPVVTWATPAAITYGTALSATQLNASAGAISGTFAYSPVAGTVLNAGANQTLSVTFTPTNATDYTIATQAVQITVNKAQPTITWATPAAIPYGTALSATQLDASAGAVAGTFVYSPPAGTVLNAGANQTLSVTFTPTNTTDYTTAVQTVQITVNKPQPVITWATPTAITYGTALSAAQLNASAGGIPGTFVYSPPAGTVLNAGANQTLSVIFTPTNTADYSAGSQTVQLTVNKASTRATVATSVNPSLWEGPVVLNATISSSAGTPTGTVSFMNGTTLLGSGTLSSGVATLTTSSLAVGSDPITAVYSGDTNFTGTSSGVFTQVVINFAVDPVSSGGSGSSGSTSQTISPGGTATNTIAIVPTTGTKFPTISYLTVTGLPPGATATLTTSGWTRLTSTSWSLPAFAQLSDVTLLFHVPASTVSSVSHDASRGKLPPALAAFFLAPFGILLCSSRKRKGLAVSILFLAVSLVTTFGLTGCGNSNGFFGQKETSYVVTITVTTGSLSHSMNVTLNVE
jgi:sugar lactone lactonase YvrE